MPISPEPPSATNISSSPGIMVAPPERHVVQQAQPLDGEVGLDRVEDVGVLVEQIASPPVAMTVTGRASSRLIRSISPSIIAT